MAEAIESEGQQEKSMKEIWKYLHNWLSGIGVFGQCEKFTIMVVGETGTGKSCLINNLLGEELATEGHCVESQTSGVNTYKRTVNGVPVVLFDTPGLGDTDAKKDEDHIKAVEKELKKKKIQLFIYCLRMSETSMRSSLIHTFEQYHRIGVDWSQTVIALTFADSIPIPGKVRTMDGFDEGKFFVQKLKDWQEKLRHTLTEQVGLEQKVLQGIKIRPTSADRVDTLPNGEEWYVPLWLDILEILTPAEMFRLLEIQNGNVIVHLDEKHKGRFMKILQTQVQKFFGKARELYSNVMSFMQTTVWGQKTEDQEPENKECD